MLILGTILWIAMILLIIVAVTAILAFRGSEEHPVLDLFFDFVAVVILIFVGAVFMQAFAPDDWKGPVGDAMTFGLGYNPQPPRPGYRTEANKPSVADLGALGGPADSWHMQIDFNIGQDGPVSLPEDDKVEKINAWTVDARGKKSLTVQVK